MNEPDMTKACDCGHPDPTSPLGHTLRCAVWRWLTAPAAEHLTDVQPFLVYDDILIYENIPDSKWPGKEETDE